MGEKSLPFVVILSTGGTIAGQGKSKMSLTEYEAGTLPGTKLVEAVPEITQYARVRVEQICNIGSPDISIAALHGLAERINAIYSQDAEVAGVVITHGTSTIEETAYFLNLTVKHDRPVVLVGSQRPATALSADGPLNLVNAVRTAISLESRGRGVLVVLNDEINAARDVVKSNTYRVETFRSGELGFLGYVDVDRVIYYRKPERRHTKNSEFNLLEIADYPKIDVLYSYVETSNALLIMALLQAGTRGIVFACTGAGTLSSAEKEAVRSASSDVGKAKPVFVRSTRVGNGRVIGRKDYDDLGLVPADNLSPQKARILLMLALTKTHDLREIKRMFTEY